MPATSKTLLPLLLLAALAACAPIEAQPSAAALPGPAPEVSTEVFFYPNHGQDPARQDRDRFECYLWARQQTGFDPSGPRLAPHQRLKVVAQAPPGQDTLAGTLTGAALGAVIGAPHNAAQGAIIGAMAGMTIGAISDSVRQQQAEEVQARYDQQAMSRYAEQDRQSRRYRRALGACLEGRGYTVR
jgi:hypothetical protein